MLNVFLGTLTISCTIQGLSWGGGGGDSGINDKLDYIYIGKVTYVVSLTFRAFTYVLFTLKKLYILKRIRKNSLPRLKNFFVAIPLALKSLCNE